jgi:hypothetical protein
VTFVGFASTTLPGLTFGSALEGIAVSAATGTATAEPRPVRAMIVAPALALVTATASAIAAARPGASCAFTAKAVIPATKAAAATVSLVMKFSCLFDWRGCLCRAQGSSPLAHLALAGRMGAKNVWTSHFG